MQMHGGDFFLAAPRPRPSAQLSISSLIAALALAKLVLCTRFLAQRPAGSEHSERSGWRSVCSLSALGLGARSAVSAICYRYQCYHSRPCRTAEGFDSCTLLSIFTV
jgi:hypothetical protein